MQNIEYKCPYCGSVRTYKKVLFTSWHSVNKHTSKCKFNTKEFSFCEYYGPLHKDIINKYSNIEQFKKDYPNLTFKDYTWKNLRLNNKSTLTTTKKNNYWNKENIIISIQQFYLINKRIPEMLDFINNENYPGFQTVKRYFGSWNKAIEAAGFTSKYSAGMGTPTKSSDGTTYRSKAESYFVDTFLFNKVKYIYEVTYGNGWKYDFYLPDYNLYIELDGGLRPERIKEKIAFHQSNNVNCKIIPITDIYKESFKLDDLFIRN